MRLLGGRYSGWPGHGRRDGEATSFEFHVSETSRGRDAQGRGGTRESGPQPLGTGGGGLIAAKLEKTSTPGIFRRHAKDCEGGRCACPYVVVWRHRGKQYTDTFRTLAEAREEKGSRDAGDRRPVARVGFDDYFADWIESYAGRTARGFSETTRPEYRRPIERVAVPKWGTWRLADVEPADVRDLFGEMRRQGSSTSAIKKLRAALSAMFGTAVEDGLLRANPVQGVRIPPAPADQEREEDGSARALTRAELAMLLKELPANWRLFFEFLTHTGLRISEAIGLTWTHVEFGPRPRVLVREQVYRGERRRLKSRHARRDIPLSPGMAGRLAEHRRDTYKGDERPVFASSVGTELIPGKIASRVLAPAAKSVGLTVEVEGKPEPVSAVSFHTFRHTYASLLFESGQNVKQVQELLGHADPSFTLRTYVHLLDDGVGDVDFLDAAITADLARVNAGSTQRQEMAVNPLANHAEKTVD